MTYPQAPNPDSRRFSCQELVKVRVYDFKPHTSRSGSVLRAQLSWGVRESILGLGMAGLVQGDIPMAGSDVPAFPKPG